MSQIKGIVAKFGGTCPLCGQRWEEGDIIDKVPGEDNKRGHAGCVARAKNGQPAQMQQHPQAQYQQPPAQQRTQSTTPPAQRPTTSGVNIADDDTLTALWTLREAMTQIAQGAMKAAVAVEQIARVKDPHHVAERKEGTG